MDSPALLPRAFFAQAPLDLARALIGATLLVDGIGGIIIETEAYDREDPASHSHGGPSARNAAMFGPPGHAYVYRSYGIHWCLNFVCDAERRGSAVLVRALEPVIGLDLMRARRGLDDPRRLCAGPGRLCQALGVTRDHDRLPLDAPPFAVLAPVASFDVASGPRVGISRAAERPWRFGAVGSPYLSRPIRTAR